MILGCCAAAATGQRSSRGGTSLSAPALSLSQRLTLEGKALGEFPVVALEAVPAAGILGRAWDTLRLWLK